MRHLLFWCVGKDCPHRLTTNRFKEVPMSRIHDSFSRRDFLRVEAIGLATLAGTCAFGKDAAPLIASTPQAAETKQQKPEGTKKPKCKITVLKTTFQNEIAKAYKKEGFGPCRVFTEGQEFVLDDPWHMPNGFCSTAWGDIFKNVQTICLGGNFPSNPKPGTNISCCTDGARPVIFKIERIEEI
jgi:uncharacterized repeat protein (TIGR04076 family)